VVLDNGDSEEMSSEELEPLVAAAAAAAICVWVAAHTGSGASTNGAKNSSISSSSGPKAPPVVSFASAKAVLETRHATGLVAAAAAAETAAAAEETAAEATAVAAEGTAAVADAAHQPTDTLPAKSTPKKNSPAKGERLPRADDGPVPSSKCSLTPLPCPAAIADSAACGASVDPRRQSLQRAAKDFPVAQELAAAEARSPPAALQAASSSSSKGGSSKGGSGEDGSGGGGRAKPSPVVPGRALKVIVPLLANYNRRRSHPSSRAQLSFFVS
jgi:hypothetical protein